MKVAITKCVVLPIAALSAAALPALAHDGVHGHGRPHRLPDFDTIAPAPEYVQHAAGHFSMVPSRFSLIGLPDTQNYSSSYPQIFTAQTSWVVGNRAPLDIRYVSQYGDITNNADQVRQWQNADASLRVLDDAGIIYGVCPGNHDVTPSGGAGTSYIPANYREYFGPQRFAGRDWYGGASPSGMSNYTYFSAGGVDFLQIHLDVDTPLAELAWAQGILDANKDRPAMITTHRYLQEAEAYTAGVPAVPNGRYPAIWYSVEGFYNPNGIQSEDFFQWFLRKNTNIFMVTCGHFHGEWRQQSLNVAGKPIQEVLADYQDDPNGGNGWLQVMRFDTVANTIDVDTYSPTLQAVRNSPKSDFTLSVNFADYALGQDLSFVAFQEGVAGYAGTQDTWINQQSANTSYGNSGTRTSDDDVANSLFSDYRGQALLRFDGIVGGGAIPAGSTVVNATLVLDVVDDIDTPLYNPNFIVHPVIRAWDEASTWNSLSGGLTVGADLGAQIATFSGDNSPNSESMRRIDITQTVQSWVNGTPNWGIAILPQIISGNDDGIDIRASENTNTILRPRLEVTFRSAVQYRLGDLDRNGIVDGADLARILNEWGRPSVCCDLDNDGTVGGNDLGQLLTDWF
jgi:hypothetical protein